MIKTIQKGFTLIELAIVIAILGILAAVALNNLGNTQASAECSMIKDMAAQLASGYGVYTAAEGNTPADFQKYVVTTAPPFAITGTAPDRVNPNISLVKFGPNAPKAAGNVCTVGTTTITCAAAFNSFSPTYTYNNGAVTYTSPVKGANTQTCQ